MQTKKQEIEVSILAQAELEFYNFGFQHASIRRIIKASGTTIGNFYNYFKNKDALFEALISEEYQKFESLIHNHKKYEHTGITLDILKSRAFQEQLPIMLSSLLPDFSMRFVILIEGSKGSKFENVRNFLVSQIKEHLNEHEKESCVEISDEIGELLSEQLINGMIHILKLQKDNKVLRNQMMSDYLLFYIIGAMGLLTSKQNSIKKQLLI